jgi:hypothetical protein
MPNPYGQGVARLLKGQAIGVLEVSVWVPVGFRHRQVCGTLEQASTWAWGG